MSKWVGFGPVVVLTLMVASACDYIHPLGLHPDVVWLEVLLVTGESEARMLAHHPHRDGGVPEVTARLVGPGWEAAFSETLELEACTGAKVDSARCLRAVLPEPVRAGVAYGLRGAAPLGSFTGETRVPGTPLLETDTLRLSWPDKDEGRHIPLRYRAGSDIGTLLVDVRNIFETREDGTEVELPTRSLGLLPRGVDPVATADTVRIDVRERPLRFSLILLGVGWHLTNFAHLEDPVIRPWPQFGIDGDGVYGYFDGAARSQAIQVFVR